MSTDLTRQSVSSELIEKVVIGGDLGSLTPLERVSYYNAVCESTGLNPLTQPFGYLKLNGKTVLYALKSCTDQLRKIHHVSVSSLDSKESAGLYVVTCQVKDSSGRTDASTGAVAIANLKGDALANAIMKAETKAKRRATLSICGLSLLDETEVETIPDAHKMIVNSELPKEPRSEEKPDETIIGAWKMRLSKIDPDTTKIEDVTALCPEIKGIEHSPSRRRVWNMLLTWADENNLAFDQSSRVFVSKVNPVEVEK